MNNISPKRNENCDASSIRPYNKKYFRMKYHLIKIGIKWLFAVSMAVLFISCASNRHTPQKRKRCKDCPRFTQQLPENPQENITIYEHIG